MPIKDVTTSKFSESPICGSFYILEQHIYFSIEEDGIGHPQLWKYIVTGSGLFDLLQYENKQELIKAHYSTERGRVTQSVEFNKDGTPNLHSSNEFTLYGTPGCAPFKNLLISIFGLAQLPSPNFKTDWITDLHYKMMPSDQATLKDMIRLLGGIEKLGLNIPRVVEVVYRK